MLKIEEIETMIESLSEDEYARSREWFYERNWEKWDRQRVFWIDIQKL